MKHVYGGKGPLNRNIVNSNCKQPMIAATENTEFHGKKLKKEQKNIFEGVFSLFYSNSVFFRVFRGE